MFDNPSKKLIIVCEKEFRSVGEYLSQLVSLEDDEDGAVIGCPDGSVEATIWTEKEYLDNLSKMSSNQYMLFIGSTKVAEDICTNITTYYDKHTIKYGWLGKKGVIYLPEKGKMKKSMYELFEADSKREIQEASTIANVGLYSLIAVASGLIGIGILHTIKTVNKKKKVSKELLMFAVLHFYMNDIRKFLGV